MDQPNGHPDDADLDGLGNLPDLELPEVEPDLTDPPFDPYPADPGPLDLNDLDDLPDLPDDRPDDRGPRPDEQPEGGPEEAPVDLDLDEPIGPSQPEPAEVDLSLQDEASGHGEATGDPSDETSAPEDQATGTDDLVELPLPADELTSLDVPDGNSSLADELVAAGLLAIGASAAVLRRARRSSPPDLVAHLDQLGIDARVDHLDLTGIEELLAAGHTVLLSTDGSAGVNAGAVVQIRALDRSAQTLEVERGDGRHATVQLDRFELAWADSANQVVAATGDGGTVALVPVVLAAVDLVPTR